ncbi:hypothetical protein DMH08_18435 [Actinomadura sp. WAC 06369]|nr:hypothetical protein DMH08_18435 [Actinomadura sp. WAC 06369]
MFGAEALHPPGKVIRMQKKSLFNRFRRDRHKARAKSGTYRVSWPPEYADNRPIREVNQPSGRYLIESFGSRAEALDFLRGCEVRDEKVYVIAETPEGNLGKDLIMIFEEDDGAFVELADRKALPDPAFSRENCARCGYSVIPAAAFPSVEGASFSYHLNLEDMEMNGTGFQCSSCKGLACARCYRATLHNPRTQAPLDLRCWLCNRETELFAQ